jgi:hypothetical protein
MPLAPHVRAALERLRARFEAASRDYPRLTHVLIETPSAEALEETRRRLVPAYPDPRFPYSGDQPWDIAIERIPIGTSELQVFVERDCHRGRSALYHLDSLARDAIEVLTAYGLPGCDILHQGHGDRASCASATRWMRLIHRMAGDRRPGDLLRSERQKHIDGSFSTLPEGTFARPLQPAVFPASSLVIERILADAMEQADSAPPAPETAAPAPLVNPAAALALPPVGDQVPAELAAASSIRTSLVDRQSGEQSVRRIPKTEAISRLAEGIKTFEREKEWGKSKEELFRSVNVPRSSALKCFREEQGLKNQWKAYRDQGQYAR